MTRKEYRKYMQELIHMSAEEQMMQRYEQQSKRVFTSNTADERKMFAICQGQSVRKRVKNRFSTEQAGTCGTYVHTIRFENSYITKVCKSRTMW